MKKRQWLIIFLILLHIFLLNSFFPIKEIASNKLITTTDYPIHYTMIELFKHGYSHSIYNLFYQGDLKLLSFIFYFIPVLYLQKIYVFLALFLIPFFFYFSAKEYYDKSSLLPAVFGIFIVNFSLIFKEYLLWGVFPYVFSSAVTLVAISNFLAFQKRKKSKNLAFSLIFFAWSLSIHPLALFYYLVFGIAYSLIYLKHKIFSLIFLLIIFSFPLILGHGASIYYQAEGFKGLISLLSSHQIFMMFFILSLSALYFNKTEKKFWVLFLSLMLLLIYFLGLIPVFRGYQLQREIFFYFTLVLLSAPLFEKINLRMFYGVSIIIICLIFAVPQISDAYSKHLDFGLSNDMTNLKDYFNETPHKNVWFEFSSKLIYGGNSQRLFSYWLKPDEAIITRKSPQYTKKPELYYCDSHFQNTTIDKVSWNTITNLTNKYNISHIVYWSNSSRKLFNTRINHTCFDKVCVGEILINGV